MNLLARPHEKCYTVPMKSMQRMWLILISGIVGLTVGYTAVILQQGTALAGPLQCPAQGKTNLPKEHCASGECSKECPGNCLDRNSV